MRRDRLHYGTSGLEIHFIVTSLSSQSAMTLKKKKKSFKNMAFKITYDSTIQKYLSQRVRLSLALKGLSSPLMTRDWKSA